MVPTSRAALHQHLLIVKQDRDKEFSVKQPHLKTLLFNLHVTWGPKWPEVSTGTYVSLSGGSQLHPLPLFPVLFPPGTPCLWSSSHRSFLPAPSPCPVGVCFMWVCVCCVQFLFRLIFATLLWPLKQNTPHSNQVPALTYKLSGTILWFYQPVFQVASPFLPPLSPSSASAHLPLPPRDGNVRKGIT